MEEPALVSQRQLDALGAMAALRQGTPKRSRAALVAVGTPRLVTGALGATEPAAATGSLRGKVARRRVAV